MKKLPLIIIILLFVVGCQQENGIEAVNSKSVFLEIEEQENNIIKVNVAESNGFGSVNQQFIKIFEDAQSIEVFKQAITNAVQVQGIVDIAEPPYDFEIVFADGTKKGYHLWLHEQFSTIMEVEETNYIYKVPKKYSDSLNALIP